MATAAAWLACPHDGGPFALADRVLRCDGGHTFDVARQGYVNLAVDDRHLANADTAAMVAARVSVHDHGVLAQVGRTLAEVVAELAPDARTVLDVGAGTGHHTAVVLDHLGAASGLALDRSVRAARRAARVHPRLASVVADAWATLPVRDDAVDVALHVFAPRNPAELRRVLREGGLVVVARPLPDHLAELRDHVPLIAIDPDKGPRLAAAFGDGFSAASVHEVRSRVTVPRAVARDVVAMGPSAHHLDADALDAAVAALPDEVAVTVAVEIRTLRPTAGG
ncbi:methyltransferase domain-containing protein [Nitriliruptoraceae bacterium ZYF776]|nr:methyltransferase domain-containing protein [Profundirhabdus halotolerans]